MAGGGPQVSITQDPQGANAPGQVYLDPSIFGGGLEGNILHPDEFDQLIAQRLQGAISQRISELEQAPNLERDNPELFQELEQLRGLRTKAQQSFQQLGIFDPARFDQRISEGQSRVTAGVQDQLSALGLAGSSVATGQIGEARRGVETAFRDRQLAETLQALQAEASLGQLTFQGLQSAQQQELAKRFGILGILTGQQQSAAGALAAQEAANAGLLGSIFGALGTIGGAAIGGPAGAAVGGAAGSNVGRVEIPTVQPPVPPTSVTGAPVQPFSGGERIETPLTF